MSRDDRFADLGLLKAQAKSLTGRRRGASFLVRFWAGETVEEILVPATGI